MLTLNFTVITQTEGLLNIYTSDHREYYPTIESPTPELQFEFDTKENADKGLKTVLERTELVYKSLLKFELLSEERKKTDPQREKNVIDAHVLSSHPPKEAKGFVYSLIARKPVDCEGIPILSHHDFLNRVVPLLTQNSKDTKTIDVKRL